MSDTDGIEKQILLLASKARVWRALTDAEEFGTWFRVALDGEFAVGARVTGRITYPGYEHLRFEAVVERMDAESAFSFRWHPLPFDPEGDHSNEPSTLVEFRIEEADAGTLLTVVESGFDSLPADRRQEAYHRNSQGWEIQLQNIQQHVTA